MVGAERAIDARSAPELGDDGDHGLSPRLAHAGLDRGNRAIEGAEQIKELACGGALVDMRVPTDEAERADARPVGLGEVARCGSGGLREIGAQARHRRHHQRIGIGRGILGGHAAAQRGELHTPFERDRKLRIGVLIELEQASGRVVAGRQKLLRHP